MRRSGDPEALYGAMGILAYLSSLRKAAARGYARLERPRGPLSYNNTEIESSIKSATEVVRWRQTQKNIAKTAFPALAIALVGMTGYERGTLGGFLRAAANEFFVRHPIYTLTLMVALAISAPFYYQLLHIHRLSPVLRAKRVLVTRTIAVHGVFWLIVSAFMFCTSILLFALKAVLAEPWAGWGRSHAQELAWIVVGGAAALSVLLIYALPFWPTRHDLFRAVAKRFRRVLAG
jgi:hypothetical protein